MRVDISVIHVYKLIQELCFNFFKKLAFRTTYVLWIFNISALVPSFEALAGIIYIKRPDTSINCSQ